MSDGFETFVKNALESEAELSPERLRAIERFARREANSRRRRRTWGWGVSLLTAASLTIVATFCAKSTGRANDGQGMAAMTDAIGLLCDLDGVDDSELKQVTADEMLLVWQEAPCMDLL